MGIVVNGTLPSLHKWSLEITLAVSLSNKSVNWIHDPLVTSSIDSIEPLFNVKIS